MFRIYSVLFAMLLLPLSSFASPLKEGSFIGNNTGHNIKNLVIQKWDGGFKLSGAIVYGNNDFSGLVDAVVQKKESKDGFTVYTGEGKARFQYGYDDCVYPSEIEVRASNDGKEFWLRLNAPATLPTYIDYDGCPYARNVWFSDLIPYQSK